MTDLDKLDQRLPIDFINSVKDELRKIDDIESARQVLSEAGVELKHVSGKTPQIYWGNGIDQAIRQDVLKKVLERAMLFVGGSTSEEAPDSKSCLAKLIKEYDQEYIRAVISVAAEGARKLVQLLADLDQHGDPEHLRHIAIRTRMVTSEIRQRLDDDEQFKVLLVQSEKYSGPSPDKQRETLAKKCYQIIVAADHVSRLSQILSAGNGEEEDGDEDESEDWGVVAVDPVLQMMREQHAQRGINDCKLVLAARLRRLLRDLRIASLESRPEA
jgi:hypothetical protein